MIIVCEPICKKMSHEKVNSGFLYALSLAFPGEKIRLYADKTHIQAIKKILVHDHIMISQIEYKSISFAEHSPIVEAIRFYFVFSRMFIEVIKSKNDKIFFLSFSPAMLYAIKKLKQKSRFSSLKFSFVLHAVLESIAGDNAVVQGIDLPRKKFPPLTKKRIFEKIMQMDVADIVVKIWRLLSIHLPKMIFPASGAVADFFALKRVMEWKNSADYRYIALSPHVTKNAKQYIDTDKFNFHTIILPTFFVPPAPAPQNSYAKFAIFGYGDSLVLHNILDKLAQKKLSKPYEIRIIGMDARGTEGYANVTCTSQGKRLERNEMEKYVADIDAFLILYDKARYRLSCSGSILESLSYTKPVIHFDNDCINQFNQEGNPIGIRCYSLDDYVEKLTDIIENYNVYKPAFESYRENILRKREECSIESSAPYLRESFSW